MTTLTDVENYLAARARLDWHQIENIAPATDLPFITISRQAGAGAHTLAQALLDALEKEQDKAVFGDWQILDHQLCARMLGHEGLQSSMRQILDEEYHSKISEFVLGLLGRQTPQDSAVRRQSELIRSMATLGKVIVVGRAGRVATQEMRSGVHVRLVAPQPVRVQRMMKILDRDEQQTAKIVHEHDDSRARLFKEHYRVNIADPLLYDAIWNTEHVSMEVISRSVIDLIRYRLGM